MARSIVPLGLLALGAALPLLRLPVSRGARGGDRRSRSPGRHPFAGRGQPGPGRGEPRVERPAGPRGRGERRRLREPRVADGDLARGRGDRRAGRVGRSCIDASRDALVAGPAAGRRATSSAGRSSGSWWSGRSRSCSGRSWRGRSSARSATTWRSSGRSRPALALRGRQRHDGGARVPRRAARLVGQGHRRRPGGRRPGGRVRPCAFGLRRRRQRRAADAGARSRWARRRRSSPSGRDRSCCRWPSTSGSTSRSTTRSPVPADPRAVQFGLDVATTGDWSDVRRLVELAVAAEVGGWDGFFLWDVLLPEGAAPVADA